MPQYIFNRPVGVASNGIFTASNTAQIPGGRLWNGAGGARGDLGAARAWLDMQAFIAAHEGVWIEPEGPLGTARDFAGQVHLRAQWCAAGDCSKAAAPGTSNHGWAIAVDVKTRQMAALILKYGHLFGWSWDEGQRVGEWWHFRYLGTYTRRVVVDPLAAQERRLVNAFARASFGRRERILDFVAADVREIRHLASTQRNGWGVARRAARYKLLTEWLNGEVAPRFLSADERALKLAYYGATAEQKAAVLRRIRQDIAQLDVLARQPGGGGWDRASRGLRRAHLAGFVAHRTITTKGASSENLRRASA